MRKKRHAAKSFAQKSSTNFLSTHLLIKGIFFVLIKKKKLPLKIKYFPAQLLFALEGSTNLI